jgi:cell division protein FtsZ
MRDAGTALLGIGTGLGENRAAMAARAATASPLLDLSIEGATGVLFNITGGPDMTMFEVDEAARIISQSADPDANIIFGAVVKEEMSEQVSVTVVATGFDEARARIAQFNQPRPSYQGVVSEPREERRDQREDTVVQQGQSEDLGEQNQSDVFGDKFEIPAFLRNLK